MVDVLAETMELSREAEAGNISLEAPLPSAKVGLGASTPTVPSAKRPTAIEARKFSIRFIVVRFIVVAAFIRRF